MKAWKQSKPGPFLETVSLVNTSELPKITKGDQILVKNFACSINPVDHKRGTMFAAVCPFPSVSGVDGAGQVLEVGSDVDQEKVCKPGDLIYYHTSIYQEHGTYATHSIAVASGVCKFPHQNLIKVPSLEEEMHNHSFDDANKKNEANDNKKDGDDENDDGEESNNDTVPLTPAYSSPVPTNTLFSSPFRQLMLKGAALPCAMWTAALALWEQNLNIKDKEIVFIRGGSSGVGSFAVQLAVLKGCTVIATCSERNIDFVKKGLGAHHVIDYTKNRVEEETRAILGTYSREDGVDKYLDCVSSPAHDSLKMMSEIIGFNGHAAFLLPVADSSEAISSTLFAKGVHLHNILWGGFMTNPGTWLFAREIIERCNEIAFGEKASLYIPISEFWKFDGIPEGVADNQKGRVRGKAVVAI